MLFFNWLSILSYWHNRCILPGCMKKNTTILYMALFFLAFASWHCGAEFPVGLSSSNGGTSDGSGSSGGGSSEGDSSESAPKVTTAPFTDGSNVSPDSSGYDFVFDSSPDASTVTADNVTFVADGTTLTSGEYSVSLANNTITVVPNNSIFADYQLTDFSITLSTNITGGGLSIEETSSSGTFACYDSSSSSDIFGDSFAQDTITGSCVTSTSTLSNANDSITNSITSGQAQIVMASGGADSIFDGGRTTIHETVSDCSPFCSVSMMLTENEADSTSGSTPNLGEAVGAFISTNSSTLLNAACSISHGDGTDCNTAGFNQCVFANYWNTGVESGQALDEQATPTTNAPLYGCIVQTGAQSCLAYISSDGTTWTDVNTNGQPGGALSSDISGTLRIGVFAAKTLAVLNNYTARANAFAINRTASNGNSNDCVNPQTFE